MTIPHTARLAAHCATVIADIARRQAAAPGTSREAQSTYAEIAQRCDTAATAFDTEDAPVIDGATATNMVPRAALLALYEADQLTFDHPELAFPAPLPYVLAPLGGRVRAKLPERCNPSSRQLANAEAHIFERLDAAHGVLATATTRDVVTAALESVYALHRKHARNAAAAAHDATRPCTRR
ncbi:hypothetical protein ACTWJ8_39775 (plasmid) [Streptomyces sp. SDT5-1]|uniref:hypothetical protein n=1 Tax=Streptomyces sp. SDT5-1 TaxID=3406418 RepID=UPI003FCF9190